MQLVQAGCHANSPKQIRLLSQLLPNCYDSYMKDPDMSSALGSSPTFWAELK
jgi:hypothetical protein